MDEKILQLSIALFLCGLFCIFINYFTNIGNNKTPTDRYSRFFNDLFKTKSQNFEILSYFLLLLSLILLIIYIVKKYLS